MHYLSINPKIKKSKIEKEIYGHFSEHLGRCIYEGLFVGKDSPIPNTDGIRDDVAQALRELKLPVLRWPGGCFADTYHWMDGIGDPAKRKKIINTHWGGVLEDNSFGTHEFLRLCELVGCEPYINGNLGSGTVQEMAEWVEYMTFKGTSPMADLRAANGHPEAWQLKYFAVGNENWGCGGNMTPEFYADQFRRYGTYCRTTRENPLYKIACGPNVDDYEWTEVLMKKAAKQMSGLSLHSYTVPNVWRDKGSSTQFDEETYYRTLNHTLLMDEYVTKHSAIMDRYDPDKRVGLIVDEWGAWYTVEPGTNPGFLYQQNTMRDALIAGINLNIFNKHSDRVKMANIAQLVNVLQSVILTEDDKMLKTPTYYVFQMFIPHMGATLLESSIDTDVIGPDETPVPDMTESVSMAEDGTITATLNNLSVTDGQEISVNLMGAKVVSAEGVVLTNAFNAYNTFDEPERVKSAPFTDFEIVDGKVIVKMPACSVLSLTMTVE